MRLSDCRPLLAGLIGKVPAELRRYIRGGFLPFRDLPWPPTGGPRGYFSLRAAMADVSQRWVGHRDSLAGVKIVAQWLQSDSRIKEEAETTAKALSVEAHPLTVTSLDLATLMQALIHVEEWDKAEARREFHAITGVDCDLVDPDRKWPAACLEVSLEDSVRASPARAKPFYAGCLVNFRSAHDYLDSGNGVRVRRLLPWEWPDTVISSCQQGRVAPEDALSITHCVEVNHDILDTNAFAHQDDLGLVLDVIAAVSSGQVYSPWLKQVSKEVLLSPWLRSEQGTQGPRAHGRGAGDSTKDGRLFERMLRAGLGLRKERFFRNAIRATREGVGEPELDWRLTQLYGAVEGLLCCSDRTFPQRAAMFVQTEFSDFDDRCEKLDHVWDLRNRIVHEGDRYEFFTDEQRTWCLDGLQLLTDALFNALQVMLLEAPSKGEWRAFMSEALPD
jgi:hypothetical protein